MISIIVLLLVAVYAFIVYTGPQVIADANEEIYLIRYFIWKPDFLRYLGINPKRAGRIYLHHIVRSDHDRALHSHPWNFRSIILKGSYREFTTTEDIGLRGKDCKPNQGIEWQFANWPLDRSTIYHDFKAPQLLKRPAEWRHRLEIPKGKTAWTLVFIGPKINEWGFFPNGKYCYWRKYNTGTGICEE